MSGNTLITGGSGLVGSSFQRRLPDALYPRRSDLDLSNRTHTFDYIESRKPTTVFHLAGKVGGVKANMQSVHDFYSENTIMNVNLIDACVLFKIPKLVCCLSTCIYPDEQYVKYPLTEEQIHLGPPHDSSFGYSYAKRMVDIHLKSVRIQHGYNYISVVPNNIYGEYDNFDLENGHVIPALIRKIWEAKISNKQTFEVWGDGEIFREFTYVDDIVESILFCNEHYNLEQPINIGYSKEYSLKQIILTICNLLDYKGEIIYDITKPKGQVRKPSSNKRFLELGWKQENYTSIEHGLKRTCDWFIENYPNIKGIK